MIHLFGPVVDCHKQVIIEPLHCIYWWIFKYDFQYFIIIYCT